LSAGWRSAERKEDEFWEFSLLATIGMVLLLLVIVLVLLEISVKNPEVRWLSFLALLTIGGLVIIYRVSPKRGPGYEYQYQEKEAPGRPDPVESGTIIYSRALEGNPHGQMLALKELREVAQRRVMLNLHLSRVEAEALASDPRALKRELQDPDLVWLLATDFDFEYGIDNLSGRIGQEMVLNFPSMYYSLLKKVEDLR
jgi:hypothetical protein